MTRKNRKVKLPKMSPNARQLVATHAANIQKCRNVLDTLKNPEFYVKKKVIFTVNIYDFRIYYFSTRA